MLRCLADPLRGKINRGSALQHSHRRDQHDEQYRQGHPVSGLEARHCRRRKVRRLLGLENHRLVCPHYERRQHREVAQQRERHPFGQHIAQVGADLEFDEGEHQQAHDGGKCTAEYRRGRAAQRARNGLGRQPVLQPLLPVAVHQDDGIVHREHHLQHRRQGIGNHGDIAQKGVGAHVEDNCANGGYQKQQHLHQRRAHHQQHHKQQRDAYCKGPGEVGRHHVGPVAKRRAEIAYLLFHVRQLLSDQVQALLHGVVVGQIFGHVGVYRDMRHQQRSAHNQADDRKEQPDATTRQKTGKQRHCNTLRVQI